MLYSSSPGLTWFSCPGTSLCWCGRAGLWWHSLQDSPAAPGSGSPWKQRMRLWRCNSQWHQGWLTRPGQSSGKQCGHSAAPASLAGMLWWSEEEESLKRRKEKKKKDLLSSDTTKTALIEKSHTDTASPSVLFIISGKEWQRTLLLCHFLRV